MSKNSKKLKKDKERHEKWSSHHIHVPKPFNEQKKRNSQYKAVRSESIYQQALLVFLGLWQSRMHMVARRVDLVYESTFQTRNCHNSACSHVKNNCLIPCQSCNNLAPSHGIIINKTSALYKINYCGINCPPFLYNYSVKKMK